MRVHFLKSKNIIDPESEIHYGFITSLKNQIYPHYHDFFELVFVIKGKLILTISGAECIYEEGSLILIRPDEVHSKESIDICHHINLAFLRKTINDMLNYLGEGFCKDLLLNPNFPRLILLSKIEKSILRIRFEKLHTMSASDKKRIKMELRILLIELFTEYFIPSASDEQDIIPQWLGIVVDEMRKRENFIKGMPALIELSGKSHAYMCRVLKRYLDATPTEFINDLKLNYAVNLLLHTDFDILGISLESGFESLSHFYHIFKKKYGVAPKKYRKENSELFAIK